MENDYSGWLQAAWDTDFYNIPVRGNIGARMVETEVDAHSYNLDSDGTLTATESAQRYHDFLPAFNLVVEPYSDVLVRLNLAQVMSRPDLGNLAGDSISVAGSTYKVTFSNPKLKPFRANTIDLSLEWYYGKGAMVSVAGFFKKVNSFIGSASVKANPASDSRLTFELDGVQRVVSGDSIKAACGDAVDCANSTASWTASTSVNTSGGHLDGVEVNWQQPFSFLPGFWSSFGLTANGTFVESNVDYPDGSYFDLGHGPLVNQSRWSYNTTIYYDDGTFQARMSAAFRSHYYTKVSGSYSAYEGADDTFNLDASASYKYNESLMITLDALNLTDQPQRTYVENTDSDQRYLYVNHVTGREVYLGVKYTY